MNNHYICFNSYCNEKFSTKRARREHESECNSKGCIIEANNLPISSSALFISNFPSFTDLTNDDEVTYDFESNTIADISPFEKKLICLKIKVNKIISQLTSDECKRLRLFYENHVPLSISDEICQPSMKLNGLKIYMPRLLSNTKRINIVKNANKKIVYAIEKEFDLVKSLTIRVGPHIYKKKEVNLDSMLTYRPIQTLLLSLLYDDEFWSLGKYDYLPKECNDDIFCSNYGSSVSYKSCYEKILANFGPNVIPFPLLFWSDGATFMEKSQYGSANCILLIPLLFSVYQMSLRSKGTHLVGFSQNKGISSNISSEIKSNLRYIIKAKCIEMILKEINELSKSGIMTSKGLFVPYIAVVTGDIVELRSLTASTHCPICADYTEKKVPNFVNDESFKYNGVGIKLSNEIKQKITDFEIFQDSISNKKLKRKDIDKIVVHMDEMRKFAKKEKRKMVINGFELIINPEYMGDFFPLIYIDRLHCLLLNEVKNFLKYLFSIISKECFNLISKKSDNFKYFPSGLISENIANLSGSEIAKGTILLVYLFYDPEILIGFKSINQMKYYMEILVSFSLIIGISGKEQINKVVKFGDKSDFEILYDSFSFLQNTDYYENIKRDNAHIFFCHFGDLNMWKHFGSPRHISSSFGESSLSNIKKSLRASNKGKFWTKNILKRRSIGDIILPMTSSNKIFDPFIDPKFIKVFKLNKRHLQVGFVDANRENLYVESRSVTFQIFNDNLVHFCICAKDYNNRMVIDEIINNKNKEINVYHELNREDIILKGRVLCEISHEKLNKYRKDNRGVPHSSLWTYLSPSQVEFWDLCDIIGGCFHKDAMNSEIFALLNHEYSHIITGRESVILPPNQNYI